MAAFKIMLISVCCLLVGAGCLAGVMSGPAYVLAAPIVALFGWFFIVPIFILVSVMWALYSPRMVAVPWRIIFITSGCLTGCGVMFLVALSGMRGPEPGWLYGYLIGGSLAGAVSCYLITVLKKHDT